MKKRYSFGLQILFGGLILWVVMTQYNLTEVSYIQQIMNIKITYWLCAFVFSIVTYLLVALRFNYLLKYTNIHVGLSSLWWSQLWGGLVGIFQKGIGSLIVINSISKQTGVSKSEIANRYLVIYAVDLMCRGLGLGVGAIVISQAFPETRNSGIIIGSLVVLCSIGYLVSVAGPKTIRELKQKIILRLPFKSLHNIFDDKHYNGGPKPILIVTFFSFLIWITSALKWMLLSFAIGYPLSFLFCFVVINVANMFKLIPIIPTSLGIYDLVVVFGFSIGALSPEAGLIFAMLDRITDLVLYSTALIKPQYLGLIKSEIK